MKVTTLRLFGLLLLTLCLTGCNKDKEQDIAKLTGCDSTNTVFSQLYNNILTNPSNHEETTEDLSLHSYTFEVTSPATICKIGYQSQPTFESFPYLIEIFDNTTNTTVYSGNHTFLSSNTEYVSITPVVLNVGDSYTIKRIQNNYTNDITIFIGRGIFKSDFSSLNFPFNMGILKITGSAFGQLGSQNIGLPFIDIVFES